MKSNSMCASLLCPFYTKTPTCSSFKIWQNCGSIFELRYFQGCHLSTGRSQCWELRQEQLPTSTTRCRNIITSCLASELTVYLKWKNPVQWTIQNLLCTSQFAINTSFCFGGFIPSIFPCTGRGTSMAWCRMTRRVSAGCCSSCWCMTGSWIPDLWAWGGTWSFTPLCTAWSFIPSQRWGVSRSLQDKTKSISISSYPIKDF